MADNSTERATTGAWSVVIPCFNEEAFIGDTLRSILSQTTTPDAIIVVDNGSTDGSRAVVAALSAENPQARIVQIEETAPGKAAALARAFEHVATEFVATCDADTLYPPAYLETAERLLRAGGGAAAVVAFGVKDAVSLRSWIARAKGAVAAALMPSQSHGGGYGQCFKVEALNAAGGFSPERWPYCLIDHEIIHRVSRFGRIRHDFAHWCAPSTRRADRRRVRWSRFERALYHVTPGPARDWLFYDFLARRLERRGVHAVRLRERPWDAGAYAARRSGVRLSSEA